jgi:four helix bundle protein
MAFTYRDLQAWQSAMLIAERCYTETAVFPRAEVYALSAQIRRAALSVAANIAEGHSRKSTRAYAHHVSIALGSQGELETCLELARRLGLISNERHAALAGDVSSVGKMLNRLYQALRAKESGRSPSPSP